jgi:hypothetical protein
MMASLFFAIFLFLGGIATERSWVRRTPLFIVLWGIIALLMLTGYLIGFREGLWR